MENVRTTTTTIILDEYDSRMTYRSMTKSETIVINDDYNYYPDYCKDNSSMTSRRTIMEGNNDNKD